MRIMNQMMVFFHNFLLLVVVCVCACACACVCVCTRVCVCVGGVRVLRCARSPVPVLRALSFLYIRKAFLTRLICCFSNNFRWISSINGYSNIKNGRKNIKCCEFCVRVLYCDCLEIAKKLWWWWNIVYQLFETKNFWYNKTIVSSTTPVFPEAILHECQRLCKFEYFYSTLFIVWQTTQCIVLTVQYLYLPRNKGPSVLLSTKNKRVPTNIPRKLEIKSRESAS